MCNAAAPSKLHSSNIIYDCTHGQWLLMQVAYDRKIKLFASRSAAGLSVLAGIVPDDAEVIFTGALQPKHAKRLLKMKNLHSVVVPDLQAVLDLHAALQEERERLQAKGLNKVSRSRQRFLSTEEGAGRSQAPDAALNDKIRVFLRVDDDSRAEQLADVVAAIAEQCGSSVEVLGLWGGGIAAHTLLLQLKALIKAPKLKVAIPYVNVNDSFKWNQRLGEGRGSVIWTCEFE
jgi:hypothetical protein